MASNGNDSITLQRTVYNDIDPTRPELSQSGKTVLITGGATGIGKSISRSFVIAQAALVIIVARRAEVLKEAATELDQHAKEIGSPTKIITYTCDVADVNQISIVWAGLASDGIVVDVLVSNAAKFTEPKTMFELGTEEIWDQFNVNVKGPFVFAEKFFKQPGESQKFLINVSTASIHMHQQPIVIQRPGYTLTKTSGTLAFQLLADTTPADKVQIISLHPGFIWAPGWEAGGITKDMFPFDDAELAGAFAVWASTKEAAFLHGRYVWAPWDVTELANGPVRKRINEDPDFLRVGVVGLKGSHTDILPTWRPAP
ncbi:putative Short-chain dehydrogenase [Seiridium unicorne]|uniref:Short-chain dehydrogenase n=1 Tax=Seiridium unicorne TaxID=138068 RepID=A0ABR2V8B9_9PEZI